MSTRCVFLHLWISPLSAVQDLNESLAEFNIEGGVYDGVHSAIDITKPGKSCVEFCWDMTVRVYYVRNKEWQPAYNEHTYKKRNRDNKNLLFHCL